MENTLYIKKENSVLDQSYKNSKKFGHVRISDSDLFYKENRNWYIIPLNMIRSMKHTKKTTIGIKCCGEEPHIHDMLDIELNDGDMRHIDVGDMKDFFFNEPKKLQALLEAKHLL